MNPQNSYTSLKDYVYQEILQMICTNSLPLSETFSEKQLIELFKVSKTPVREALIQLCHDEVLTSIPRSGYRVIRISPQNIHDLTELRLFLELSILPKIFQNMTSEGLDHLHKINDLRVNRTEKATVWTAWNNNVQFHTCLASFANNEQLNKTLKSAYSTCTRAYVQLFNETNITIAPQNTHAHDNILKSIEQHDIFKTHNFLESDILSMEKKLTILINK